MQGSKKTTLTGFEPVRENPMDFKSIALTTRPQYLDDNLPKNASKYWNALSDFTYFIYYKTKHVYKLCV